MFLFIYDVSFSPLGEHKFLPLPLLGSWSMAGCVRWGWYTHLQGPAQFQDLYTYLYVWRRNFVQWSRQICRIRSNSMVICFHIVIYVEFLTEFLFPNNSGEDFYTCLTMEKRGVNVMEFQMGTETSTSYNQSLCRNVKYPQETWVTQGSMSNSFFYQFQLRC